MENEGFDASQHVCPPAQCVGWMEALLEKQKKWDHRFLDLAAHISQWSKDPSTQVGCVIADDDKKVVAIGYNGFPKGIEDSEERLNDRETKYKYVVHSEPNAFANANGSVKGCTIYTYPFAPCAECMKLIITNGIKRVVYPTLSEELATRWAGQLELAEDMAREAGLVLTEL
ncbi:MAG: deoxycytidylate deaminase [Candidatus Thorarchaeota archaeon]